MKGLQYAELCAYSQFSHLILMKMLWNRVHSNFAEIKTRYVGSTPNSVTNAQCPGIPNITNEYSSGLFF